MRCCFDVQGIRANHDPPFKWFSFVATFLPLARSEIFRSRWLTRDTKTYTCDTVWDNLPWFMSLYASIVVCVFPSQQTKLIMALKYHGGKRGPVPDCMTELRVTEVNGLSHI